MFRRSESGSSANQVTATLEPLPVILIPTASPMAIIEVIASNFSTRKPLAARAPAIVPEQLMKVTESRPKIAMDFDCHSETTPSAVNALPMFSAKIIEIMAMAQGFAIAMYVQENRNPKKSP